MMLTRSLITFFLVLILSTLTHGAEKKLFKNSYAIVIGINEYESNNWENIPNSVNDAVAMRNFLENQGFIVKQFCQVEASKEKIISYLEDILAQKMGQEDRFFFYFSGHGETKHFSQEDFGYIVPYDGKKNMPSSWISMDKLRELSKKLGAARHQLFVFDSCFGGLFPGKSSMSSIDEKTPNYIDRIAKQKARQYITAGGKNERVPSKGPKKSYSYFTGYLLSALLEGLADYYPDGYITAVELHSFLEGAASGSTHTPRGGTFADHEQGNFLFKSPFSSQVLTIQGSSSGIYKGDNPQLKKQGTAALLMRIHAKEKRDAVASADEVPLPGLGEAVKKYKNKLAFNVQQQKRLDSKKYLLEYFCNLEFFVLKHKTNVNFMNALAIALSDGKANYYSPENDARGLLHLKYSTALKAAKELSKINYHFKYVTQDQLKNLMPDDLYYPPINILISCYLISKNNYLFSGKLDQVVHYYLAENSNYDFKNNMNIQKSIDFIGRINAYFIAQLSKK